MTSKTNSIKPAKTKAAGKKRFSKWSKRGFKDYLIPIIPPNAKLGKKSKLDPVNLGKIPGKRKPNGTWVGFHGWSSVINDDDTIAQYDEWEDASVAFRTGVIVGVDIDVTDKSLADGIQNIVLSKLGPAPVRTGNAPKRLLPYVTDTPMKKSVLQFECPTTGDIHTVEFLGEGQQFVAEGIHPKTGKPYKWSKGVII